MYILGISAFYHDSAAALLHNGIIVAAAQEERFSRKKHDAAFPIQAAQFCLNRAGISAADLKAVVFYDKPFIKFNRILETYLTFAPKGVSSFVKALPLWLRKKLWIPDIIEKELNFQGDILFSDHHLSHAASAFFPSPFSEAAFLTIDGVGEWATSSFGMGRANRLTVLAEQHFPHSLGLLYSAFTYFSGFKVNSGEYKLMGLAPYGEPKYVQTIYDKLIDLKADGSFRLNLEYFNFCAGLTMTSRRFNRLFDGPPRKPESGITQREMDLARSIQEVTEEIVLRMAGHVQKETGAKHLCLAGGVALNCVANGKLLRSGLFDKLWIQPAAGDAGGAPGAAYVAHYLHFKQKAPVKSGGDLQQGSLLGPDYSEEEIRRFLQNHDLPFHSYSTEELLSRVTDLLKEGNVVGRFEGRMEFGPRALGNRSILGDARHPQMQKKMNLKIKFRESFRPFAPSVLAEEASNWFELTTESPYMLLVANVAASKRVNESEDREVWGIERLNRLRSQIPAVTHVDYSARIQTVSQEDNPGYYALLKIFFEKTGCPVLVNTSFNVRGEPIVASPLDAYRCFMRTEMDALILGPFLLLKDDQPEFSDSIDWRQTYALD